MENNNQPGWADNAVEVSMQIPGVSGKNSAKWSSGMGMDWFNEAVGTAWNELR
jgi:hypothetical protein